MNVFSQVGQVKDWRVWCVAMWRWRLERVVSNLRQKGHCCPLMRDEPSRWPFDTEFSSYWNISRYSLVSLELSLVFSVHMTSRKLAWKIGLGCRKIMLEVDVVDFKVEGWPFVRVKVSVLYLPYPFLSLFLIWSRIADNSFPRQYTTFKLPP